MPRLVFLAALALAVAAGAAWGAGALITTAGRMPTINRERYFVGRSLSA